MPGHQCASAHQRKHTDEKRLLASRVPPKAREYLSELAVDRELERFMALSSTNSSGTSRSNTSMYTAPPHCTPRSVAAPSKPARCRSGQQQEAAAVASVPKGTQSEQEIIKVTPIVATECVVSASVEDLRTPPKQKPKPKPAGSQAPDRTPEKKTKNTQTPESSAMKSHKRLEWDPAADVGYYKRAVSTSNLSTLERSVLEECWRQPQQRSETDLDRLQLEPLPLAQPPPLASSTFVHRSERRNTHSRGSSSNQSNRSSSRRELTSPTGGSSVASSFDYHHSSLPQQQPQQLAKEKEKERQYTAAQLEKVLASRRQARAKENKENCQPATDRGSSTASSSTAAGGEAKAEAAAAAAKGDLDLGVDLLCSLVQSHSLSHSQKKVLIRNIAKRISCIEFGDTLRSRQSPSKGKAAAQLQDMATNTTASVARPVPAPRTRILMANNSGSSAASSSKEMVTARSNPRVSQAASEATETEQRPASAEAVTAPAAAAAAPPPATARAELELVSQEWLNPMTQSEIEYEERSRSRSRSCSSSNDSERRLALRSIELEIERLQLMYKMVHRKSYGQAVAVVHGSPTNAIEYKPLISVEAPQQEVRPPVGAPEAPLHTQEGLAPVERASDELPAAADVQAIPTPPPAPPPPPAPARGRPQREKMATPNSSNSDGGRSESVCSFVQQRQRQFMEHYQNQQQQQLQQLQQHQQQQKEQQKLQRVMPRMQLQQEPQQEPQSTASQHYIQMAPGDGVYYTAVPDGATTTTTTTTASSSSISSMLCLSSEMSIPMAGGGVVSSSKTTTTTTTSTTHQYDEATTGSRGQRQRRDRNESQQPTQTQTQRRGRHGIAYMIQFVESEMQQTMSLQDHLQLARPKFCAKSKQRKAILNQMQMLRSERRRELEQLLGEDVTLETLDRRLQQLPPPVTSCVRVFSTKEMKALTSKRCQRLPEVVAAQNRVREEQRRRSNRLMRDVFNRRMQSRVSKGKISLNHSLTII
ncbi:AF4/FMR2 family member lilli [Drosophila madeirensis]|uniref:AF4/FMR2 family member lilli n=1 Tax=Drosophila madeirensis TaxID=30013 RepID=A0AAU9G375_DROMD